jgi:hypothetical protein
VSDTAISIAGERPDFAPNPSTCTAFRESYPTLFHPLQTETFDRIRSGRSLALVAPTSSGKTLAVAAPLFEAKRKAVFVYPFRALVLDQTNQLVHYGKPFGLTVDDFAQVVGGTPDRALARAVGKNYILMTPDKLVSLLVGGRTATGAALAILTEYVFVFDEIHAYNSLMLSSLVCFIRSVRYWREGVGSARPSFYFLSATFPEQLWLLIQQELGLAPDDRIEGRSNTGDVELILRPGKDDSEEIAADVRALGMDRGVVGIFNTAFKAWEVATALWGAALAKERLFVGQDKMSEAQRVRNFRAFENAPRNGGLCGSPAIEAGVDFLAPNEIIEESYADSFLHRFGRSARSGLNARVLCYSSTLYAMQQQGLLREHFQRGEFLAQVQEVMPVREARTMLNGLAAYPYHRFWDDPPFIEADAIDLCRKLEAKGVDPLLSFRGFTPYTEYETGERINYRTLFKRDLPVKGGVVLGSPGIERYFFAKKRPPVIGTITQIGHFEQSAPEITVLLAKVVFEGFGSHWVVLEIKSVEYERLHPREEDDNICLRLPSGEVGRVSPQGARNGIVKFYEPDA